MEIKSISYEDKTLTLFCEIRDEKDLKMLSFILSGFASGYFCNELSPEEIENAPLNLLEDITFEFEKDIIHSIKVGFSIIKKQLAIFAKEIGKYRVIEERFLKTLID